VGLMAVRLISIPTNRPYGILESLQEIGQGGVLRHRQSKETATERQSTYTTAPAGYSTSPVQPGQMPPLSQLTTGASSAIRTCLQHFVYVPPHRVIPTDGAATPTLIPQPDGSHLPEVLFTLRNHKEPKFLELQDVMQSMFPETGEILTVARQPNQIAVTVEDRFAKIQVPLKGCGTGVQQILHWVGLVLFSNSGRIFLMDEPHVYLHAQAERAFANFLRAHPEHHYVIATHSPMLIDALQPERINLVSRDEQGTAVRPVYHEMSDQHRMLAALGWRPSQFAWAERVLFVEGPTEVGVFEAWFRLWGWVDTTRCAVVDIEGFGTSRLLRKVVDQLETLLAVPMLVYLDGDQKSKESSTHVEFLPELEIENVLVRDRKAVFTGS